MNKIDLDMINAYKVKVRMTGNYSKNVMVTNLNYEKDQEVYVLSKELVELLIRSHKDYEPQHIKALKCIEDAIRSK